jgi:hypothetical protein
VYQAVLTGDDFDKGSVGEYANDFAQVDLADLGLFGEALDHADRLLGAVAVCGCDKHCAIVLNVNLGAGFLSDVADILAAGADEGTDLLGVDFEAQYAWGVLGHLLTRGADDCFHLVEDEEASVARLGEGFLHDFEGEASGLEIKLHACDTVAGSGYLEVHIAQSIFYALDVGQHLVLGAILALYKAHRYARDHGLERHTSVE